MKISKLPRIYYDTELLIGLEILVPPQNTDYIIKVLRLKNNDKIRVFNEYSGEFIADIKIIKSSKIFLDIQTCFRVSKVFSQKLTIGLSLIKNNHFIEAVKGAVQFGVTNILPIHTDYSQHFELNYDKMKIIIIEALKQSERIDLPEMMPLIKLDKIDLLKYSSVIYANEHETSNNLLSIKSFCDFKNPLLIVGPEGGLSQLDLKHLKNFDHSHSITLGNYVLRSEIAASAFLAQFNLVANHA